MIKRDIKRKKSDIIMRLYKYINLWCDLGWSFAFRRGLIIPYQEIY